ncbi:MAG: hypothetical protein J6R33_05440, partial [Clostridia bacterium]|nr:hypothetical protein [Clostridia bacterium]
TLPQGEIGTLVIDRVLAKRLSELVRGEEGKIDLYSARNILLLQCPNGQLVDEQGRVGEIVE